MFPEFSIRGNKVRNLPSNSEQNNKSLEMVLSLKILQAQRSPFLSLPPSKSSLALLDPSPRKWLHGLFYGNQPSSFSQHLQVYNSTPSSLVLR